MHTQPLTPIRKLSDKLMEALARHGDYAGADERTQLKAGVSLLQAEGPAPFDRCSPADASALDTFRFASGFVDLEAGNSFEGPTPSISDIKRGSALTATGETLERFLSRSWINPESGAQAGDWFIADADRQPSAVLGAVPLSNRLQVRDAATGLLLAEVDGNAEPNVDEIVHLLREAIATFGKPRRAVLLSSSVWCAVNCPSFTHFRKGEFPDISLPVLSKAHRARLEEWLSDHGVAVSFTTDAVDGTSPLVNAERSDEHHRTTELAFY